MPVLIIAACLIYQIFAPTVVCAGTTVDLKAEAVIGSKSIMLSDVASISGDDAAVLSRIVIAGFSDGATNMNISAKTVENRMKSHYLGTVLMTGAQRCHVVSSRVEVSEEILKRAFVEAILKNSPWKDTGTIDVVDIRVSRLPKVLQADMNTIQAKFSSFENYLGFTNTTMLIGNGPLPEKITVTGKVRLIAEIPVVKTRVAQGSVICPGDLALKQFDISANPHVYTRLEDCAGKRAKVSLRERCPIGLSQLERRPDIIKGETVVIEARTDNLAVRDRGIAMKDGFMGEPIRVKNVSSGRQVVGTIIAASLVQVEL